MEADDNCRNVSDTPRILMSREEVKRGIITTLFSSELIVGHNDDDQCVVLKPVITYPPPLSTQGKN